MLVIKVLHTLHLAIVSYFACDCKNLSYLNLSNEQIIAYQENQNQSLLLCVPYTVVTEVSAYWAWALCGFALKHVISKRTAFAAVSCI